MYNRYIPQPDGSFQKKRIIDEIAPNDEILEPTTESTEPEKSADVPQEVLQSPKEYGRKSQQPPRRQNKSQPIQTGTSIPSFLHQLLPKEFDTSDLFVILLLLLISGDNQENQSTAMLTLALYLFM